jgi:hypothetical protein
VSVLGASAASALLNWLQENGYQVNASAHEVLDGYVDQNWAFVVIKLNPSERRNYENEFLPPLTIKYRHDQLIFPLRISSVSTTQTIKITLYVIAESTVSSSNFPTSILQHEGYASLVAPEIHFEAAIHGTIGSEDRALVVMWFRRFGSDSKHQRILHDLMKTSFPESSTCYLTRLETRIDPEAMTEDIRFALDPKPNEFHARIYRGPGEGPSAVSYGVTPLMYGARYNQNLESILLLLEAGADFNAQNDAGQTVLMSAAGNNPNPEVISVLLEASAEVNAQDKKGRTALAWAYHNGRSPVVISMLREASAVQP